MARNRNHKIIPSKPKLKKDPGVPKLPDLKLRKNIERQKVVQQAATAHESHRDTDAAMASEPTLSSLAMLAEASGINIPYEMHDVNDPSSSGSTKVQMRKHYIRTLHKVIDQSDIVILVLDARDPEGCRSRLVEEEVRRREHEGKKLVFVLNKIDLVPRSNAEAWLRYLRHNTPTLPFRASTQQQRSNLTSHTSPALLNLLKSYKRGKGSITVGVVGYPNVGKSSLINSLRRARVCAVAAEAGHTKEMQSVQVERGVRVLDSPGVVFDDDDQEASNILLRNVVKVEDIPDPIAVVEQILLKTDHTKLSEVYKLPQFSSTLEFLGMLAMTNGRLLKGGTPDILSAARQVIKDWNAHKISYFSVPPVVHPSSIPTTVNAVTSAKYNLNVNSTGPTIAPGAENVGETQIVTSFAPAFDLGGLFNQADKGAFRDYDMDGGGGEEIQEEYMDEDGNQMISDDLLPSVPRKRSRSPSPHPSTSTAPIPHAGTNTPTEPPSKRLRSSREPLTYDTSTHERQTANLASHNPLSRRVIGKSAKAARKAERKRARVAAGTRRNGRMEVDNDGGGDSALEFTFMAGLDGIHG